MRIRGRKVLGTRNRGKTPIFTMKQIRKLEVKNKSYTRFVYGPKGKRVVKKVRRNVR